VSTYDEEFLKALAAKGIVVDADGHWAVDANYTGTPPSAEQLRYFNEVGDRRQYDINAQLRRQWVESLDHVADVLVRDGERAPWPYASLFWIRLYGLFDEIPDVYEGAFQAAGLDRKTYRAKQGSLLHICQFALGVIDMIRNCFTEDEHIYADYRRQGQCHPTQASYDLRLRNGKIIERRGIPALGLKEFTVADLDAACKRILKAYKSEHEIAVAFAGKAKTYLPNLLDVMRIGTKS
jgi:hypothetical protein